MNKLIAVTAGCVFSLAATMIALSPAAAGDRYSIPAPVKLSSDLTEPWVLQLGKKTATKKKRKTVRTTTRIKKRKTVRAKTRKVKRTKAAFVAKKKAYSKPKRKSVRQASLQKRTKKKVSRGFDPKFLPQVVSYSSNKKPGTIIIDTNSRFLYLVLGNGKARRYGVGVGKLGFEWTGTKKITRKAEWPSWTPPKEMIARERKKGRILPAHMPGGPKNPMGARALYLGSSLYRIHGTNQPWSIGLAVSSGCIRMRNEDVMDLYERTKVGVRVHVI